MTLVSKTARYLLGLMFTIFGLNGFLQFIHQPPPTNPLAVQFMTAIFASHFAGFLFAMQLVAGLLLLSGFFVPLGLAILAGELYNILGFHLTMAPKEIGPALLAVVLWVLTFLPYRDRFAGLLSARPATEA